MILEHIHLTNFRCFESLSVPLDRQLNVFIGGNGAGKTAILDSIALALAPIPARLPLEKNGKARPLLPSDIRLTGEDRAAPFSHIAADGLASGSAPISWDRIRFRDQSPTTKKEAPARKELRELYTYLDRIIDAHNANQPYKLPVFALYSTTRAVDVPHYRLRKEAMPKHFRRLAGLEDALQSKTDFRHAVAWFDFLEQRELRDRRDRIISATLPALDAVRQAISSMLPEVSNPRIDGTTGRFAVDTMDPNGTGIKLHLDQLSDGYQVMLGVVMDFALRLALANPPEKPGDDVLASEAILCIDEVDLHLHPSWQQRVIPDLRRTFPNTQLILTTHSPQVATTVPSTNLRILRGSQLYAAPAGTEGAEAQRLLQDAFLVQPRPKLPPAQELEEYLRLVDERKWDADRARELRRKLDEWSQGEEPRLLEADLQIENMKWEAGQGQRVLL
jgi:predicted ATP-binding protein involved in virulence